MPMKINVGTASRPTLFERRSMRSGEDGAANCGISARLGCERIGSTKRASAVEPDVNLTEGPFPYRGFSGVRKEDLCWNVIFQVFACGSRG
jgi:hypothetical protein